MTTAVDAFMAKLEYRLKAEVQAVRELVKGVDPGITEQIKWNAPSFSYEGQYLVTLNLRSPKRVLLVWHNPAITSVKSKLLEGDYPDRRLTYLDDLADVAAKRDEIERVVREVVGMVD